MKTKKDPDYEKYVEDKGARYVIDVDKLPCSESIECPRDPDMYVKKNPDQTVTIVKKAFTKKVFIK